MINREEIISRLPLVQFLTGFGHEFKSNGKEMSTRCPFHDDHDPSLDVNTSKNVWTCRVCGAGGTVIDYLALKENIGIGEAMRRLEEQLGAAPKQPRTRKKNDIVVHHVATYDYADEHGKVLFHVSRAESKEIPEGKTKPFKTFTQYHVVDGKNVMGIGGIRRVLYRMQEVAKAEEVFVAEGEKCVHALEALGCVATCNPGGGNGWLAAYGDMLAGKHVIVMPDNDDKGWCQAVLDSCRGKVATVRVANVGEQYNDIADMVDFLGAHDAGEDLNAILLDIPRIEKGIDSPLRSMASIYRDYVEMVKDDSRSILDLGRWLPSLRQQGHLRMRPIVRGEMVALVAGTGKGKSAAAMNIIGSHPNLKTILFSLELPDTDIVERGIAMQHRVAAWEVERSVKHGQDFDVGHWHNLLVCDESGLTLERMEKIITESELIFGAPPDLVVADYIGLVKGAKGSRYERMSEIADGFKALARKTKTVQLVLSQIARKGKDEGEEVGLHDGKDSGNIEQSAQIHLGLWRDENGIVVRVNKSTKGGAGIKVNCDFHGPTLRITERLGAELPEDLN
ncbi:MAG: DnaB-like helicase C-terminal domain-containing protein [Planctomycetota bacterium]|jgi:hypothetical protein